MKLSINFCSTILDSSVSKTVQSGSNLSTPQISEEYDQWKNVKKKLDEQLADVRKQLHENYNSFKSNNEFLHYQNKPPPTTLINHMSKRNNVNCRRFHASRNRQK